MKSHDEAKQKLFEAMKSHDELKEKLLSNPEVLKEYELILEQIQEEEKRTALLRAAQKIKPAPTIMRFYGERSGSGHHWEVQNVQTGRGWWLTPTDQSLVVMPSDEVFAVDWRSRLRRRIKFALTVASITFSRNPRPRIAISIHVKNAPETRLPNN